MSSVRDRIRNLQQESNDPSSTSANSKQTSVTQLAKNLESLDPTSTTLSSSTANQTLSSRVAKFDAASSISSSGTQNTKNPPSHSLFDKPLSKPAQIDKPLTPSNQKDDSQHQPSARKIASDNEDGRVASRVRAADIETNTTVNDARKVFEKNNSKQNGDNDNEDDKNKPSILSRAAAFEDSNPSNPSTTNSSSAKVSTPLSSTSLKSTNLANTDQLSKLQSTTFKPNTPANKENNVNEDGLASRAAVFERRNNQKPPTLNHQPSLTSKNSKDSSVPSTPYTNNNNDLNDQLAEVKALNNKLVKSLIDLTENYRRLELTRDSLQKRITDLEAAAK